MVLVGLSVLLRSSQIDSAFISAWFVLEFPFPNATSYITNRLEIAIITNCFTPCFVEYHSLGQ